MNALAVLNVSARVKGDDISETDTKVLTNNCGRPSTTREYERTIRNSIQKIVL
jgi:hypothetical protein